MSSGAHAARGAPSWARRERLRWLAILRSPAVPWVTLAAIVIGTGGVLMHETRGTTIWLDEWTWLLHRRGDHLSTFLASHDGHLSVIPIAIYRLLFATAGLRHSWPYRALMIAEHLGICVLLFAYARRRVGALLALVATGVILVFGAGWEDLLWSFQITWNTSLLAGLAALLALDRRDLAGDIAACLLLVVSLASSGIGVPIVLGAALEVVLVRRRAPAEWWVAALPIVLYGLWAIDYQHTIVTADGVLASPGFVATGLASTMAGLAGLSGTTNIDGPGTLMSWGPFLLLAAVALAGWRLSRSRVVTPRMCSLVTILLAFWVLTALTRSGFADPYSSRYLYVSGLFVVLIAVELLRGLALRPLVQGVIVVAALVAVVSNVGALRAAARLMRDAGLRTRADLAAVDIGRPVMPPGYILHDIPGWPLVIVPAADYFSATSNVGTPAVPAQQVPTLPEPARETADRELIAIHGVSLVPAPSTLRLAGPPVVDVAVSGTAISRGACVKFTPNPFAPTGGVAPHVSITVPATGLLLRASGGPSAVGIRRFGSAFAPLGQLVVGREATLAIAPDASPQPWHVLLTPTGPAVACGV